MVTDLPFSDVASFRGVRARSGLTIEGGTVLKLQGGAPMTLVTVGSGDGCGMGKAKLSPSPLVGERERVR